MLKGSFRAAGADIGTQNALSIHLGGASLWFEEELRKRSLSDGVDTLHFTSDALETWGI
jgi:hypothetical protein